MIDETEQKIEPALTAEEWADHAFIRGPSVINARDGERVRNGHGWIDVGEVLEGGGEHEAMICPAARHGLAALVLHGQPFGFTWEMVDALRGGAGKLRTVQAGEWYDLLDVVADRIAALLPPREES